MSTRKRSFWIPLLLALPIAVAMSGLVVQTHAQAVVVEPGWRYFDGYWNYWDPADKAWYYTDGRNWYYYGDDAWRVYHFDKAFGKSGFHRETYNIPGPATKVVVPRHKIYIP